MKTLKFQVPVSIKWDMQMKDLDICTKSYLDVSWEKLILKGLKKTVREAFCVKRGEFAMEIEKAFQETSLKTYVRLNTWTAMNDWKEELVMIWKWRFQCLKRSLQGFAESVRVCLRMEYHWKAGAYPKICEAYPGRLSSELEWSGRSGFLFTEMEMIQNTFGLPSASTLLESLRLVTIMGRSWPSSAWRVSRLYTNYFKRFSGFLQWKTETGWILSRAWDIGKTGRIW